MKQSLLFKLILCFIINISVMFMGINTLGPTILKSYLASSFYNQLTYTGSNIATGDVFTTYFKLDPESAKELNQADTTDINNETYKHKPSNDEKINISAKEDSENNKPDSENTESDKISVTTVHAYIDSISQATSYNIWLLDNDGNFLYSTDNNEKININNYHKRFFYMDTHNTQTIKNLVEKPSIFSINKIRDSENMVGYIVLYAYDTFIDTQLAEIMPWVNIVLAFISIIIAIMYILIYFLTIHPIHKLTTFAIEASQGKIKQRPNIKSNDEYNDLSNALFYLTSELNNIDEYQRNFISNISHDFRSPLTSIKGYLEAMLDGTIPPENYEKYLNTILFESNRLTELTTNLLTLNQLDNTKQLLNKSSFDINYIISKTTDVYEGRCQKNKIKLETNFENKKQFVTADQAKIQQVINNILDNAIKFSPNNSSIKLSTYVKGEKVFLSIKDHGQGIPKESLPHIWDRFYKTDTSRGKDKKGTGLGLAITKEIINAHHENINVISTEGVGTEFCFSLPKSK